MNLHLLNGQHFDFVENKNSEAYLKGTKTKIWLNGKGKDSTESILFSKLIMKILY